MTSEPDQIRSDIQQTQQELGADVDALTEKLSPPRIVQRRAQRTRVAMTNVKDKIMGSPSSGAPATRDAVSSTASGMGGAVSSTASAAKDKVASTASSAAEGNPLAAGLIAFGAGWLISSVLPATAPERQVATQVKDLATEKGRPVAQQLGEAAQQAKEQLSEPVRQSAESVKETMTSATSTVADEAKSAAGDVTSDAQQAKDKVTEQTKPYGT
jgi:hypothetical protein